MMIRSSTAATATITNNLASENCVVGAKAHGSVFKIADDREKIGPLASIFRNRFEKLLAYGLRRSLLALSNLPENCQRLGDIGR